MKLSSLKPIGIACFSAAIGACAATFYLKSLTAPVGSSAAKIEDLEHQLARAKTRVGELEDLNPRGKIERSSKDGFRSIAQRLKNGEKVTPDDIFNASKPLLSDMSPIFARMSEVQFEDGIDSRIGELTRLYHLTPDQQHRLKTHLNNQLHEKMNAFSKSLEDPNLTLKDFGKIGKNFDINDSSEEFLTKNLQGEDLAKYKKEVMKNKAELVQQETDRRLQRIRGYVDLTPDQEGALFQSMAQQSEDYDPQMKFESTGSQPAPKAANSREALMSVLTPEQKATFSQREQQERAEAEKNMNRMGLSLPSSWDLLETF